MGGNGAALGALLVGGLFAGGPVAALRPGARYAAFGPTEARVIFPYLPGRFTSVNGVIDYAYDSVVVRHDERKKNLDYFIHANGTIHRTVWHARLSTQEKRRIFADVRRWWPYLRAAKMRYEDDALAWELSLYDA